jgi:hypothetical protein
MQFSIYIFIQLSFMFDIFHKYMYLWIESRIEWLSSPFGAETDISVQSSSYADVSNFWLLL